MQQNINSEMKKRFKSKRSKASRKGLGHEAAKATSQQEVTNCSISFLPAERSCWRALGAGDTPHTDRGHSILVQSTCRSLHSDTALTGNKRKLFTLEISPGKWDNHPGTRRPTTKAMSFLITWLFHGVINLFRKLLGKKLPDWSPLVFSGEIFTGQGAQVISECGPSEITGCSRWLKVAGASSCYVESCLTSSFTTASSSFSEA